MDRASKLTSSGLRAKACHLWLGPGIAFVCQCQLHSRFESCDLRCTLKCLPSRHEGMDQDSEPSFHTPFHTSSGNLRHASVPFPQIDQCLDEHTWNDQCFWSYLKTVCYMPALLFQSVLSQHDRMLYPNKIDISWYPIQLHGHTITVINNHPPALTTINYTPVN